MPENSNCSGASSCSKESCEGCSHNPQSMLEEMNPYSDIKHVIGVVSGKGGVGKSFITSSLAVLMAKAGYKVGILDADITGPSIPKMFGAHGQIVGDEKGNVSRVVVDPQRMADQIYQSLERNFTPEEWNLYMGEVSAYETYVSK